MHVIRTAQMNAFSANSRRQFENRLIDHVIANFPEQVWNWKTTDLQQRVAEAIDRALAWQFEREEEAAAFVSYTFELGEHFDTDPAFSWVFPILQDRTLSGQAKIQAIEDGLCDD